MLDDAGRSRCSAPRARSAARDLGRPAARPRGGAGRAGRRRGASAGRARGRRAAAPGRPRRGVVPFGDPRLSATVARLGRGGARAGALAARRAGEQQRDLGAGARRAAPVQGRARAGPAAPCRRRSAPRPRPRDAAVARICARARTARVPAGRRAAATSSAASGAQRPGLHARSSRPAPTPASCTTGRRGRARPATARRCCAPASCAWSTPAASYDSYASDITRTFPADGRFTGPQRALYELVLAAQEAAIAATRPGARKSDAHWAAVAVLAPGLLDLGLLDRDAVGGVDDVSRARLPALLHAPHRALARARRARLRQLVALDAGAARASATARSAASSGARRASCSPAWW